MLHRLLRKVDPESALRIQPRDLKRIVRALEVFFLTGRPLTAHFADTVSPIPDVDMLPIGLRLPARVISERVTRRVDQQFERGLLDEIRGVAGAQACRRRRVRSAVSSTDRQSSTCTAFATKPSTRALIAQENRRYARRQLIWFRKEPNLQWFDGPGDSPHASPPCNSARRAAGGEH